MHVRSTQIPSWRQFGEIFWYRLVLLTGNYGEEAKCTPDPTWQGRNKFLPFPVIGPQSSLSWIYYLSFIINSARFIFLCYYLEHPEFPDHMRYLFREHTSHFDIAVPPLPSILSVILQLRMYWFSSCVMLILVVTGLYEIHCPRRTQVSFVNSLMSFTPIKERCVPIKYYNNKYTVSIVMCANAHFHWQAHKGHDFSENVQKSEWTRKILGTGNMCVSVMLWENKKGKHSEANL